jgi:hypothetical protein
MLLEFTPSANLIILLPVFPTSLILLTGGYFKSDKSDTNNAVHHNSTSLSLFAAAQMLPLPYALYFLR